MYGCGTWLGGEANKFSAATCGVIDERKFYCFSELNDFQGNIAVMGYAELSAGDDAGFSVMAQTFYYSITRTKIETIR